MYSATSFIHTEHSDMDHTVLPANYTMPAYIFLSIHQRAPSMTERQVSDAAYYSLIDPGGMTGSVGLVD